MFRFCIIVGFVETQLWVVEVFQLALKMNVEWGWIYCPLDWAGVCVCAGGEWSTAQLWCTTIQKRQIKRRRRRSWYCTAPPDFKLQFHCHWVHASKKVSTTSNACRRRMWATRPSPADTQSRRGTRRCTGCPGARCGAADTLKGC